VFAYFFHQLNLRTNTTLYTDADNLITLLRNPHPKPGEWSLIPLLKTLQKKLDGTPESLTDKEMRGLVVPILAAEGLMTNYTLATGREIQLRFIPGIENPADILTKPRDVLLLAGMVTGLGSARCTLEAAANLGDCGSQGEERRIEGEPAPIVVRVPALGEAVTGSIEVDNLGEELEGDLGWVVDDVLARGQRNGLEQILEMARIPQPEGEGIGGDHRATRTGYGLRPTTVLREPQRLAFLVSKIVGATLEAMGWGSPGSNPMGSKAP
jgi:hypothetical protein